MEQEMYEFIELNEDSHWWFRARLNIIRMFLDQHKECFDAVLDIGCGSGKFLRSIKDISKNRYGIEEHSYKNADSTVVEGDALAVPFEDNSMDLVTMLDVLEHIPESDKALCEMRRVMKENGLGIVTVPALNFLYSAHDLNHHHVKRYYRKELKNQLSRNGFQVIRCSYFNTWLFPAEAIIRLLEKVLHRELTTTDHTHTRRWVNNLLYTIFNSETKILRKHDFPYGLSLIAVVDPGKTTNSG